MSSFFNKAKDNASKGIGSTAAVCVGSSVPPSGYYEGVVVDANNAPMPRIGVRFVPDSPDIASPGRRLLAGGPLSLPQAITTVADGSFVLEVASFGGGLVQAIDGTSSQANGVRVEAQRGKVATGLRVTASRR